MEQYIKQLQDFMVMIRCFTYNHSNYITDALNGFTMQITNFPFVTVLVDDASTDGEQNVINNYVNENFNNNIFSYETDDANISLSQHKTNQKCFMVLYYLKQNHYSIGKGKASYTQPWRNKCKYEAICEGDDYWTDPLKLQKQVDFLEANPEYSMCFHRSNILNELEINPVINPIVIEDKDYSADELFENWIVPTASIVYRKSCYIPIDKYIKPERMLNGDIILVLNCASRGKIRGFSDTMSVYRMHSEGVTYDTRISKNRTMRYPDHYLFIKDNFPMVSKCIVNKAIAGAYMSRALVRDRMIDKMKDLLFALYYHPFHFVVRTFNYFIKHVVRQ